MAGAGRRLWRCLVSNQELIRAVRQLEEEKGLSTDVLVEAIEAALLSAYKKNFGQAAQNRSRTC